jgi:hypothetical protein
VGVGGPLAAIRHEIGSQQYLSTQFSAISTTFVTTHWSCHLFDEAMTENCFPNIVHFRKKLLKRMTAFIFSLHIFYSHFYISTWVLVIKISPGANPTTLSFNATAVKIYNATNSIARS